MALLVGLIAGGGGSLVGAGGGFLVIPFLLVVLKFEHPVAVATSLVAVLATAAGGTFAYARLKRIDYRTGLVMTLGMIPGVFGGAYVTQMLDDGAFQISFGAVMGAMAVIMIWRAVRGQSPGASREAPLGFGVAHRNLQDSDGVRYEYRVSLPLVAAAALAAGALSSAFGIGGGMILMPLLVGLMAFPVHVATATSMFVMIPMALLGIVTHMTQTSIEVGVAAALAVGVLIGSQVGARLSQRFRPASLSFAVSAVVTVLAVLLIYRGITP